MNFLLILIFLIDFSWATIHWLNGFQGSDTDCDDTEIEKYLTTEYDLRTKTDGNFVRLECSWSIWNFPTYNGVDPFTEIECTVNGWSLPNDMKPVKCKHITCPAVPELGEEIVSECLRRDSRCIYEVPGWNDGGFSTAHFFTVTFWAGILLVTKRIGSGKAVYRVEFV